MDNNILIFLSNYKIEIFLTKYLHHICTSLLSINYLVVLTFLIKKEDNYCENLSKK